MSVTRDLSVVKGKKSRASGATLLRLVRTLTLFLFFSVLHVSAATVAIKVDQAGYLPDAPKLAMVVPQSGPGEGTFVTRRVKDGSEVFQGKLSGPMPDSDSGEQVRIADFTKVTETGQFYLDVPGVGTSWHFRIAPDVYRRVYYLAMRSYYGQRCGTAVDLGSEFPVQSRFHRISFKMSGVPFPDSGSCSEIPFTRDPYISHVHSSVPVVMPEFTT